MLLESAAGIEVAREAAIGQEAPDAGQASTFANAEVVRWLEWGTRSYQRLMLGITFLLVGTGVAWSGRLPGLAGYLAVLIGLIYLVQGWLLGTSVFASAASVPTPPGLVLELGWAIWVALVAWRLPARTTPYEPAVDG